MAFNKQFITHRKFAINIIFLLIVLVSCNGWNGGFWLDDIDQVVNNPFFNQVELNF